MKVLAHAPGRVNLIGDHTDYAGGLVLPMAIDLGTSVELDRGVPWIELISDTEEDPAFLDLDFVIEPSQVLPSWARYVAAVAHVLRVETGGRGFVRSTLPIGAGLSSSASFCVAATLALGFDGPPTELARAAQQAEHMATGVPCGLMDQLASVSGVADHALLIDCHTNEVTPVAIPDGVEVIVVDSGQHRSLASSNYGVRKAQADEAATLIGPLREVTLRDVELIEHDDLRQRARHVVSENERVRAAAEALRAEDVSAFGQLMAESHASLRDDFEVSTSVLDELVDALRLVPGVHGARLTGAGFGGCVVVVADEGTEIPDHLGERQWTVEAASGATVRTLDD